jgi:hypothetical protein
MKRRGLAIRVAVVAVVSAVGLGVVASPALAMDDYYCDNWTGTMERMEQTMQTSEVGSTLWNSAFNVWNKAAALVIKYC